VYAKALAILETTRQSSILILAGSICFTLKRPSPRTVEIVYASFQSIKRWWTAGGTGELMRFRNGKYLFKDHLAASDVCDLKR
jgi:hypothetical protein